MKKVIVIALVLIGAGIAGFLALRLVLPGPAFTLASNAMLPLIGAEELVYCNKEDTARLAYGDLVIYLHPNRNAKGTKQLKMIAGLAGDTVQMRDGVLWINGKPIPKRRAGEFELPGSSGKKAPRYEETLPGGVKIFVLDTDPASLVDNTGAYTVPADHVFVIGNNRDLSLDSRIIERHGPVPAGNIICKAEI